MQQSFLLNLYPNAVANTKMFGADSIKLIGVMNIYLGLGEIAGGGLFALFGKFIKNNQKKVYIFAFLFNLATYLLILLNHPNLSTIQPTDSLAIIEPRQVFRLNILLTLFKFKLVRITTLNRLVNRSIQTRSHLRVSSEDPLNLFEIRTTEWGLVVNQFLDFQLKASLY